MSDERRIGAWELGIKDRDPVIRQAVIRQISDCGDTPAGRRGVPVLLTALRSADYDTHCRALHALAHVAPDADEVLNALIQLWTDGYPINCWATVELAARAGSNGIKLMPLLLKILADACSSDSSFYHDKLLRVFGRLGPDAPAEALPLINQAMYERHVDERVNYAAVTALAQIGAKGLPYLLVATTDSKCPDYVRWHVVETLGTLPDDAAQVLPTLTQLVGDKHWSNIAIRSLGQLGQAAQPAASSLLRILAEENADAERRATAASAVWRITGKPWLVLPTMQSLLQNRPRQAVLAVLLPTFAAIGPPAAVVAARLQKILRYPELPDQHRILAAVALWRTTGSYDGRSEMELQVREHTIAGLPEIHDWAEQALAAVPRE